MQISRVLTSTMVFGTLLGVSATAWSEEPAAAPATAAATDMPAATAAPAPAPEAAPAPAPAPDAAAAAPSGPSSWFRIDSDNLGLQLWAGTTNSIGSLNIATDIYVGTSSASYSYGEFDIGPAFTMGDLSLTPMIGLNFDWGLKSLMSVVPQFYTIYNGDPLYFESWIQVFLNSIPHSGGPNTIYTRDFLLFKATKDFRIGPAVEATLGLNTAGKGSANKTLVSLPIGGTVAYNALGDWKGQIIAFLGVETQDASKLGGKSDNLVGRLTYVQSF